MRLLEELVAEIAKLERDYPTPPVRIEVAFDLYKVLEREVGPRCKELTAEPVKDRRHAAFGLAFLKLKGLPLHINPMLQPGEWGPIYRSRS